jgi:hypothetical protein
VVACILVYESAENGNELLGNPRQFTVVKSGIMIKCFFYFFPMKVFVKTPDRGPGNPTEVNLIKLCKKIAKATTSFFNESHLCIDKAHRSRLRGIGSPVTSCNDD